MFSSGALDGDICAAGCPAARSMHTIPELRRGEDRLMVNHLGDCDFASGRRSRELARPRRNAEVQLSVPQQGHG